MVDPIIPQAEQLPAPPAAVYPPDVGDGPDMPDMPDTTEVDDLRQRVQEAKAEYDKLSAELLVAEDALKIAQLSVTYDPAQFVAIDGSGNGDYAIAALHDHEGMAGVAPNWPPNTPYNERYLQLGSATLEHVANHQGVWAYRKQD